MSGRRRLRRHAAGGAVLALTLGSCVLGAPGTAQAADPLVGWQHRVTRVLDAQKSAQGQGVTIAILDSGVGDHPYLKDKKVVEGVSSGDAIDLMKTGKKPPPEPCRLRGQKAGCGGLERTDVNGHGTAMAGVAVSVAPKAAIMPLRFEDFDPEEGVLGGCSNMEIAAAQVDWAVDHGADVISMSFGTTCDSMRFRFALQRALAKNVVFLGSAGNDGGTIAGQEHFPSLYPGVIAVAATDPGNAIVGKPKYHWASTTGRELGLAAPGVDYTTLVNQVAWKEDENGGISKNTDTTRYYHERSHGGTSAATAFVAGVAALVKSKNPQMSGSDVIKRLLTTAKDLGRPGRDAKYGFGLVDARAAVSAPADSPAARNPLGYPMGVPGEPKDLVSGANAGAPKAAKDVKGTDAKGRTAQGSAAAGATTPMLGWAAAGVALLAGGGAVAMLLTRRRGARAGRTGY